MSATAAISLPSPLIVALDVPILAAALSLGAAVRPYVAMVKVGLEGFLGAGRPLIEALRARGLEVFLDLKLHDIPRTAAAAAAQLADLDVRLLTVHASGGPQMVEAVRRALPPTTKVVAVTVLTSLEDALLRRLGMAEPVAQTTHRLGELALQGGADGLVCSAHELDHLADLGGLRVVPGIRAPGDAPADQRRVATAAQAYAAGADYLVVGRPIALSADPAAAAAALLAGLAPRAEQGR